MKNYLHELKNTILFHLYVKSKQNKQKLKQTQRYRDQTDDCQREEGLGTETKR